MCHLVPHTGARTHIGPMKHYTAKHYTEKARKADIRTYWGKQPRTDDEYKRAYVRIWCIYVITWSKQKAVYRLPADEIRKRQHVQAFLITGC